MGTAKGSPLTACVSKAVDQMRSSGELKALFAERGVDIERAVVTSCGSGITAAIFFASSTHFSFGRALFMRIRFHAIFRL